MRDRDVYIKITRKSYSIRGMRDIEWDYLEETPYDCIALIPIIRIDSSKLDSAISSEKQLKTVAYISKTHFRNVQGLIYNCDYSCRRFFSVIVTVTIFIAKILIFESMS